MASSFEHFLFKEIPPLNVFLNNACAYLNYISLVCAFCLRQNKLLCLVKRTLYFAKKERALTMGNLFFFPVSVTIPDPASVKILPQA